MAAAPIPTYQKLTTVEALRKLINESYAKEISEGQVYDPRDIQRFNENDDYAGMFVEHGQYGKTFDEKKALKVFHDAMSWRKANNIYDISTSAFPAEYFDRRAIYFQSSDVNNAPILLCLIRKLNKGREDNEAVKRFITYNFEEHIRANPGQRITIFFDMSETGLSHLDYDLVKHVINCLIYYYPAILSYMLVYKLPFVLRAAWKLIKSWLPAETQNAVIFADEKTVINYVTPEKIPEEVGSTAAAKK